VIEFQAVLERMKELLREKNGTHKVLNKTVADALGLSPKYFAVIKKRGKIPYRPLALFAQEENINLNWILLGTLPKYLHDARSSAA
jgi:hypothetical protein